MYLDRVTVDEGGVELLGGHHLLLEHLEVVLHQGGLVFLPWLAEGGEAWLGAPKYNPLPRGYGQSVNTIVITCSFCWANRVLNLVRICQHLQ